MLLPRTGLGPVCALQAVCVQLGAAVASCRRTERDAQRLGSALADLEALQTRLAAAEQQVGQARQQRSKGEALLQVRRPPPPPTPVLPLAPSSVPPAPCLPCPRPDAPALPVPRRRTQVAAALGAGSLS